MTALPTPAMIEAAARAYCAAYYYEGAWDLLTAAGQKERCAAMQAALTAAMSLMLEESAKVALDEKVDDTGEETDTAYNMACDHIATTLRSLITPT